jgi:hypothetical protein
MVLHGQPTEAIQREKEPLREVLKQKGVGESLLPFYIDNLLGF